MTARLGVVKQSFFGLPGQYGRRVTKANLSSHFLRGMRDGLMLSAIDSRSNAPGSGRGKGHCVVFSGKTLYSHCAALHPGVSMGA